MKWSLRQSRFSLDALARLLSLPLLVTSTTTLGFVYVDSVYFHGFMRPSTVEITPLNFLRYNLLPSNLAEHGLHPRWLHLVVNLPMIATPGLLFYVLWAEFDLFTSRTGEVPKGKPGPQSIPCFLSRCSLPHSAYYWVRWSATSLLSIQPHQEPRFLTPLLVPMIAIAVNNARITQARKSFLISWITANAALAVLFGVLHQGGVVPSLFRIHDIVYNDARGIHTHDFQIVYWKTYMPPRHLLAIRQEDVDSRKISVQDLSGASPDMALDALLIFTAFPKLPSTLLVAPFHAVQELGEQVAECLMERDRVFPHLDLDHIGESVQTGWKDGLSLGIFDVDVECLRKTPPYEP
ncbi:glycosylphosphatidylinositol-alpha 1,2 mannosyltransferase [Trametes versicolor FP-101664 SS1]|uniref:glycosylphosphatidylinositol-alpha 1,2 mannosyltransferase n=1 Tax=Trametes versicolor (strain FP-101664) TaxID=717944 RepID=UPI0004623E25|nr:glycosylphosphatidylinositol-alpha 1,2 mannosyltransferase [Trametes versicolor FP-101664 SS1]EIW53232.1 hypothetical protein TRAVEDRAFT_133076 [Trametes versicolor FP-101664 SS1]